MTSPEPLTIADFRARFPEFDSTTDIKLQATIDDTQCNFSLKRWGCHYTRGHCLYVAHILTLDNQRSAGGNSGAEPKLQKTSMSADGLSIGYNTNTSTNNRDSFLMSTNYGQEYLSLLQTVRVPGFRSMKSVGRICGC